MKISIDNFFGISPKKARAGETNYALDATNINYATNGALQGFGLVTEFPTEDLMDGSSTLTVSPAYINGDVRALGAAHSLVPDVLGYAAETDTYVYGLTAFGNKLAVFSYNSNATHKQDAVLITNSVSGSSVSAVVNTNQGTASEGSVDLVVSVAYSVLDAFGNEGALNILPNPLYYYSDREDAPYQFTLTVTTGGRKVRVYLSATGSQATNFQFYKEYNTNVSTSVTFDQSLLAEVYPYDLFQDPPDSLHHFVYSSNGFFVGARGNRVYFSQRYMLHNWPFEITLEDSVNKLVVTDAGVYVLHDTSIVLLQGSSPETIQQATLLSEYGSIHPNSVAKYKTGFVFSSTTGVHLVEGLRSVNLTADFFSPTQFQKFTKAAMNNSVGMVLLDMFFFRVYDFDAAAMSTYALHIPSKQLTRIDLGADQEKLFNALGYMYQGVRYTPYSIGEQIRLAEINATRFNNEGFSWRSSRFKLPRNAAFSAFKVYASSVFTEDLPTVNCTFHFYTPLGELIQPDTGETLTYTDIPVEKPHRLIPVWAGYVEVVLEGGADVSIDKIELATSLGELL